MAQIPQDLITEILVLLPVKPLLRFRSLSKSLLGIIDSDEFIKLHLRATSDNRTHRKIIVGDSSLHHQVKGVPLHVFGIDVQLPPEFYKGKATDPTLKHRVFAHCNGLVVLEEDFFSLVVWNPSTRKCRKLPVLYEGVPMEDRAHTRVKGLCFGYDSSIDDYKVLLVKEEWGTDYENSIWILVLRSDYWRKIEFPHNLYLLTGQFRNCYVDGAFHFLCVNDVIFAFDLANETFSKVSLPDFGPTRQYHIGLEVSEGCLCVSFLSWGNQFELYSRKKNDVGEFSWTKLFTIVCQQLFGIRGPYLFDMSIHKAEAFLCIESLVWIDVEEKERERERKRKKT